eukprot:TRINITY_DN90696_c0_g1_i1.p1 TRINITY_DN90696_c0_g1~~TRINITY_DN90696_c0_g1_i1.p1  ORF type:complete len:379 (-),score=37.97 TRINITY_DN90696_c0_g1_i1:73-1098(-)
MCMLCIAAAAAAPTVAGRSASPGAASDGAKFFVATFVHPVLFTIPFVGIKVYSYGICVASALASAFLVFAEDLRRCRLPLDAYNAFFVFLAGFAIGSKAHLALQDLAEGKALTLKHMDIRTGHSFMGSIIGAVTLMLIQIWRARVSVMPFLDVLLPCCLIGHVLGKVGCFLSGDGCYGRAADPNEVPWAMSFPYGQVPIATPVHPTPVYEGLMSLTVVILARLIFPFPSAEVAERSGATTEKSAEEGAKRDQEWLRQMPVPGRRTALVLVLYGIERMVVEQYRRHPPIELFLGLTEYQAMAAVLLVLGVLIDLWARRSTSVVASKAASSEAQRGQGKQKVT